jgi:hypothetical protein
MLFRTDWFPEIVARIFADRPKQSIWEWADDDNVFLDSTMSAEPGFYRSSKTIWTRRFQELMGRPYHNGRRIRKIVWKKASQTGITEAILNAIRYFIRFAPRNVIYAIDAVTEAVNIRERLVRTLDGEEVFTGDPDDLGRVKLTLRHMIVWFFGSFSAGKFANKQAPFGVVDEAEEHAKLSGDTTTSGNVEGRTKTSEEGLVVVVSKPKLKGGVIDKEHALGDQEIFLVPCPHCGTYQELTIEKLKFSHCKDLLQGWDLERVLNETYMECEATFCKKAIFESAKPAMVEQYHWFPTNAGDPEVISFHISDLYSPHSSVSWGVLAKKMINSKHDRRLRQDLWNNNLGLEWEERVTKPEKIDILNCKSPYKRGEIPFPPVALLLGSDIGKSNAKWVVGGVSECGDVAAVDWGDEIHPDAIAEIVNTREFVCRSNGQKYKIDHGAIDAKYRVEDSYAACMKAPLRLWPVAGGGGRSYRKTFGLAQLPTYPPWLQLISFNDRDFKTELYIVRIKREVPPGVPEENAEKFKEKMPRLLVPENVTDDLIRELVNEHLEEDEETGLMEFRRKGPNHYGDCIKEIILLWRWMNRNRTPAGMSEPEIEIMGAK